MNLPGCTWGRAAGNRIVHIFRFGRTLCRRRFKSTVMDRELEPDKLVMPSPGECENCRRVFNALVVAPEPQ